jgi:hypothetical protein
VAQRLIEGMHECNQNAIACFLLLSETLKLSSRLTRIIIHAICSRVEEEMANVHTHKCLAQARIVKH